MTVHILKYFLEIVAILLLAFCLIIGLFPNIDIGKDPTFHYEYVYEDYTVRRYDRINDLHDHVTLDLIKDGIIIDRVKAPINRGDIMCNGYWGLYFSYRDILIIPEKYYDKTKCYYSIFFIKHYFKFKRNRKLKDFLKNPLLIVSKNDKAFLLDYLDYDWCGVEEIKERLRHLSLLKDQGLYYPLDLFSRGLDTLYHYDGENSNAVKMRVISEEGHILYTNGK